MPPRAPEPAPAAAHRPVRVELRAQLALAVPLAVGHFGQQVMGMVDTAMLGRYSDAALAGAGIANGLLFAVTVLGIGIVMGLDALVPQALGAGDPRRARRLFSHGVRVACLVGAPLVLIAAATPSLLPLAGVEEEVAVEGRVYVLGRLPAIVPFLLFAAQRSYLQAHGATLAIVVAMIAGNAVNVVADALFIFGDGALTAVGLPPIGLPAMGVLGAAMATSLVSVLTVVIAALAVRRLHGAVDPPPRRADPLLTRAIVRLGLPIGLQLVAEVGIFALTSVLAGRLGTVPAAAHQIAITISSATFSIAIGIGAATSVRVGRAVGAHDHRAARRAGLAGLGLGAGVMGACAVVLLAFPAELARLFTNDPVVVDAAVPLLRVAAIFQLSDGAQAIAAGALRGAGDTRATFYANLAGHYVIGVNVAIALAFGLGLGALGLWWGLLAGLTTTAAVLIARFVRLSSRPIPIR
jgi:multidrug resistance protein, MATE family